jgi:hypothetical protein
LARDAHIELSEVVDLRQRRPIGRPVTYPSRVSSALFVSQGPFGEGAAEKVKALEAEGLEHVMRGGAPVKLYLDVTPSFGVSVDEALTSVPAVLESHRDTLRLLKDIFPGSRWGLNISFEMHDGVFAKGLRLDARILGALIEHDLDIDFMIWK